MPIKLIPLILFSLALTSCGQTGSEKAYSTDPGIDSSITFDVSADSTSQPAVAFPDTVTLRMDSTGKISWLDRSIKMVDLEQEVQDSLLNIYLHTGKLPSWLDMQYQGTVTMGIRGAADDMIRQAQRVVINVITVKTLQKPYGKLDSQEKDTFQKQYPVLFQKYY